MSMLVRCERHGGLFEATPATSKVPDYTAKAGVDALKLEMKERVVINCPTCGRGYEKKEDGSFVSDRKLTVYVQNTDKPTQAEITALTAVMKKQAAKPIFGTPRSGYREWLEKLAPRMVS